MLRQFIFNLLSRENAFITFPSTAAMNPVKKIQYLGYYFN